jgi:hypothetical protein
MSLTRGVLLVGKFRTHAELNQLSQHDQRQVLISELVGRSHQAGVLAPSPARALNRLDDEQLAGVGALFVFLREARVRDDATLRRMTADDMRNVVIIEVDHQTGLGQQLQGWTNLQLVERAVGHVPFGQTLTFAHCLRGALLWGKFRSPSELNGMSEDDMRNIIITELTNRTSQPQGALSASPVRRFQAMDSRTLAGVGLTYAYLRDGRIRSEDELRRMTDEDMRNTLIVEVHAQTNLGTALQGLATPEVVAIGLGLSPEKVLPPRPGPGFHPPPAKLQFRLRGFNEYNSTDSGAQGPDDEVYLSAQGTDSATIAFGPDGTAQPVLVEAPVVGDISAPEVRDPWAQQPFVLMEFDFTRKPEPRTYMVVLLIVEHDNQDLAEVFEKLKKAVGDKAREKIVEEAVSLGVTIGSAVNPGVGTVVGAAVGGLVGLAWDELIPAIGAGLANEVFTPRVLSLQVPNDGSIHPDLDRPLSLRIREDSARYELFYDWHVVAQDW